MTAQAQERVPMEPPAIIAGRSRCPRSASGSRSGCTSSASAAIWVSAVRAPVPMSAAVIRTVKVPSASAVTAAVDGHGARGVGGRGRAGPEQPAPVAAQRRAAGRGPPSRTGGRPPRSRRCRLRLLNGSPDTGPDLGFVAERAARSGPGRTSRRVRPSPTPARTSRVPQPGARMKVGVGTSSRTSRWRCA